MNEQLTDLSHVPLLMMTATDCYRGGDRQFIHAVSTKKSRASDPPKAFRHLLSPGWPDVHEWLENRKLIEDCPTSNNSEKEIELRKNRVMLIRRHHQRLIRNWEAYSWQGWIKTLLGPSNKSINIITFVSDCHPYKTEFCQRFTVIRYLMTKGALYLGERLEGPGGKWLPNGKWLPKMIDPKEDLAKVMNSDERIDVIRHHLRMIEALREVPNFAYKSLLPSKIITDYRLKE